MSLIVTGIVVNVLLILIVLLTLADIYFHIKYSIEFSALKDKIIKQSELIEKQYAIVGNLEDEVAALRAYQDDGK